MSRELPILMNARMVQAILEGRKTMTRRLVQPVRGRSPVNLESKGVDAAIAHYSGLHNDPMSWGFPGLDYGADLSLDAVNVLAPFHCGDQLYVRETWAARPDYDDYTPSDCGQEGVWWKASLPTYPTGYAACHGKWRPSIHMPKWAARIWLEVTAVRVERLQDITEGQARAEGVPWHGPIAGDWRHSSNSKLDALPGFAGLWDSLAISGAKWSDNPWVWVVSFRRIEGKGY